MYHQAQSVFLSDSEAGVSSVVETLPNVLKAWGSIPNPVPTPNKKENILGVWPPWEPDAKDLATEDHTAEGPTCWGQMSRAS